MTTIQRPLPRLDNGDLQSYAWPGGYPLYYLDGCNCVLCPACANASENEYKLDLLTDLANWCIDPSDDGYLFDSRERPVVADINYKDDTLYCDDCNCHIESAYGPSDDENE